MKVTVLGCGASGGTPMAGGFWGRCDPAEPRNERSRASLLVESADTSVLIDASCDLRLQMNRHRVQKVDALLLTHEHSDHTNGMDDLRAVAYHHEKKVDLYAGQSTMDDIRHRWPYLFKEVSQGVYKGFLTPHVIAPYTSFTVGDIGIRTFEQDHMTCMSMGYRFGDFAYCVDVADLDDRALSALSGIDTWIVDACGYMRETPTVHANIRRIMSWVERLKPRMTYLTVLSGYMDYMTLCDELPPHIRPAYDGLEINIQGDTNG